MAVSLGGKWGPTILCQHLNLDIDIINMENSAQELQDYKNAFTVFVRLNLP